jgi:hypothetical protein
MAMSRGPNGTLVMPPGSGPRVTGPQVQAPARCRRSVTWGFTGGSSVT